MTPDASLIAKYLKRYGRPRTQLFFILLLTGAVGVLASIGLLLVGMRPMWLRYPTAATVAYLFFLWVLRLWARRQLSRPEVVRELQHLQPGPEPAPGHAHSPPRFLDWLDFLTFVDDTALTWILAGLLIAGVLVALVVAAAPVLLAEILLDALMVAGLWHRLRHEGATQTMSAAVRATRVPAALVVLSLAMLGAIFQWVNPAADSVGDLF